MVAIFGASVTQQKNGYATILSSKLQTKVNIYGYGGMHLNNAGICFIDKVIQDHPSYCFVDWFSTGYIVSNEETKEYIDTIIYKFSEINCKVIFLFFPNKEYAERKEFYSFCKNHLEKRNIYYIDLASEINEFDLVLRDVVHTTDYGSDLYAKIISKKFIYNKDSLIISVNTKPTKYTSIRKTIVNKVFYEYIEITGKCEIIGFLLTIGPHSGMVAVSGREGVKKYNIWDKWCHFPRKDLNLPMKVEGKVQIKILQDQFDTNDGQVQYNFDKVKKYLIVHEIYYIGEFLNINNRDNGKRIPIELLYFKRINGRIHQYSKKTIQLIKNFIDSSLKRIEGNGLDND